MQRVPVWQSGNAIDCRSIVERHPRFKSWCRVMINKLHDIERKITSLKTERKALIDECIKSGYGKIVYAIEGGDGYYHWVDGHLVVVLSKNREFMNNLKFIRKILTYDESTEYEPVGPNFKLLDSPDDMEMILDVNIDLMTEITPVIEIIY